MLTIKQDQEVCRTQYIPRIPNTPMGGSSCDKVYSYLLDRRLIAHCDNVLTRKFEAKDVANRKGLGKNSFRIKIFQYGDFACCTISCRKLPSATNDKNVISHHINQLNTVIDGCCLTTKVSALVYYNALGVRMYALKSGKNGRVQLVEPEGKL